MGFLVTSISSWYLLGKYSGVLVVPYDFVLNNIPHYNVAFLYDIFVVFAAVLFIFFIFHKHNENKIGYYLFLFGILNLIRGICIFVTPLGNPISSYNQLFNGNLFSIGTFFSGHLSNSFLAFLFSKGIYRNLILFCAVMITIFLFLSKAHYSIDIIAGFVFAYAIYSFGEKYLEKRFTS